MSPADEKNEETTEVEETAVAESPVEPEADATPEEATETEALETEVDDAPAEEAPTEVAEEPEPVTEEPVAETPAAKPRRSRGRAKPSDETPAAPAPATARRGSQPREGAPVVTARAKYVRTSARKARLVADHVRGKSVTEARAILAHTPRAVAEDWEKLLNSAVANAEHNHELLGDDLRILSITADEGPTLKRFRPRAMGRASRIRKRTSHLSIALTPKEQ